HPVRLVLDHEPAKAEVADEDVGAAAEHEPVDALALGPADGIGELLGAPRHGEDVGRTADPEGRVRSELDAAPRVGESAEIEVCGYACGAVHRGSRRSIARAAYVPCR